ncbi:MAG TPA: succinate dehydrogenase, hydrophobic membrane anchor protein [Pseudolabrys sp.]|nr:succinate dehydrogenase, hydrophobic membrane anchor protein [Pseudolabrys sp.]
MTVARRYSTAARRVRGLGAARTGTGDFITLRVTSAALLILTIGFVVTVAALLGRSHAAAIQILASPLVAIVLLLFILTSIYHMWIGMQEIIIDYVHRDLPKFAALIGNTFFCVVVGVVCVFALARLTFGL